MSRLHLTKVAVGCPDIATLATRLAARAEGGEVTITTRYRPKRADEVIGGSIYWIISHQLVARQTILGFETAPDGQRISIRLDARLVEVVPQPRRAHQGWRYLEGKDAPPDIAADESGVGELPPDLRADLAGLGLI